MIEPKTNSDSQAPTPNRQWPLFASLSGYTARYFGQDLVAGLTLSAIAIPEQMATARLAGLPPQIGFVAFVAGAIGFAIFGANRYLSVGADSTVTPIFAGGLAMLAVGAPQYAGMVSTLALMVGMVLIASAVLRLGWIADILSIPVTTGFLAGISVHIVASQLPSLLGVAAPSGVLVSAIARIATELAQTNLYTLGLGLAVLAITMACDRLSARVPGALVGIAVESALVAALGLESRGVTVLGAVSSELPILAVPAVTLDGLVHIIPLALIVSLVVMLQTGATTRSFVSEPGVAPRIDRDFAGVGVGCLLAGVMGAFPLNASPPRTAIAMQTGARSQLAGLVAAAILVGLVFVGSGLMAKIPHAALAGVLLFIATRIFRLSVMVDVYRRSLAEFALIIATMIAIIVLPIETGVGIGIVLSLLHGMWTTTRARPIELFQVQGTSIWWAKGPRLQVDQRQAGLVVVAFQAPLSFLNVYAFKQGIADIIDGASKPLELIVLEASSIIALDFTASKILVDLIERYKASGVTFAIARLESVRAQQAFASFGVVAAVGEDHIFHSVDEAVRALAMASQ